MEEKTLREWVESMNEENNNRYNLYGVMEENDDPNFIPDYIPWYTKKEFLEKESNISNRIVVRFIPSFLVMGELDKPQQHHHLFIIKKAPFDYTNKTQKEIFEHLFKEARFQGRVIIQENKPNYIEVSNFNEDTSIRLVFRNDGTLFTVIGYDEPLNEDDYKEILEEY